MFPDLIGDRTKTDVSYNYKMKWPVLLRSRIKCGNMFVF